MKPQLEKIINDIKILKSKVIVTFNDEKINLTHNTYTEFRLYKNKIITNEEYNKIISFNNSDKLLLEALMICSRKDISKKELIKKLKNKCKKEETINNVISYLEDNNIINDETYLFNLISMLEYRKYGYNNIKQELIKKGISKELIDNKYIKNLDKEYEFAKENLAKLLNKKMTMNYLKSKRSHYENLIRLGFDNEVIQELFKDYPSKNEKLEEEFLRKDYDKIKKEPHNKIVEKLLNKLYSYDDIKKIMEE